MARRFEFEEGGSSKFWEVSVDGSDMTVVFGKIGTNGQSKTKSFPSDAAAQKEADKLVGEKTRKGYVEVGGASAPTTTAATEGSAPAASKAPKAPKAAKASEDDVKASEDDAKASSEVEKASEPAPQLASSGAADAADAPVLVLDDGDRVRFAMPAWVAEEMEPAVTVRIKPRKAGSYEETWKVVFAWFEKELARGQSHYRWPTAELGVPADELAFFAKVRERLESRREAETFDPDVEAYLFAMTQVVPYHLRSEPQLTSALRALAYWTAKTDPATAAKTMLRVTSFGPVLESRPDYVHVFRAARVEPKGFGWGDVTGALREHARMYGVDAIAPVLRAVPIDETSPDDREGSLALLAWILDDTRLATACIAEARARGALHRVSILVGLAEAAEDAREFVGFFGHALPDGLLRAMTRHGLELAKAVLAMPAAPISLLACYPSLTAARILVARLEHKQNRKQVGQALAEMPAEARVALEEAKRKKLKYRDAIDALLGTLESESTRAASETPREEAPPDALPKVLVAPPWHAKKKAAKVATFDGLGVRQVPPVVDLSSIPESERRAEEERARYRGRSSPAAMIEQLANAPGAWVDAQQLVAFSLEDLETLRVAGALPRLQGKYWIHDGYQPGLTVLLHRHGASVIPALLALVPAITGRLAVELAYAGAIEVGPLAVHWLSKKGTRKGAIEWARRFPRHAAAALIPVAVASASGAKETRERDGAQTLLLTADRAGHRSVVLEEARHHGAEVEAAVQALLERDPLEQAPSKPPKLPDGLDGLPTITLRDGRALPKSAHEYVLEMLAFSDLDAPYIGLEQVKEACDPRSLDVFIETLVRTWIAGGMVTAHEWAVRSVALLGTDRSARFLFDRARAWAQDNQKQRALLAIDVLGAMGTDLALSLVGRMSRSSLRQYMKDRATELLAEIAEARGLSPEELEDRTAPDLGLDENGSMIFDFGARQFRVSFDENLTPLVLGPDGARLDSFPRASKTDDAAKAKLASEAWKALKGEAEKVARDQILRLERMMGEERRVDVDVYLGAFVRHPLIGHLARRLVWAAYAETGALIATFRIAEDRSFATVDDDAYELPAGARIGIPHVQALHDAGGDVAALVARWGEVFADYAIVQPFGQLARPILEGDVMAHFARFHDVKAPTSSLFGLRTLGWRSDVGEYGDIVAFRRTAAGQGIVVQLQDPIAQGGASKLHTFSVHGISAALPRVMLSELAFQLGGVVAR